MALTTPFAQNGNKTTIPQTTADGSVSYDQGFGSFYALPPEEGGLFIDRAQFNQLMYDTTSQVIANTTAIATKANANATVNLTGNQNIAGVKTFTSNISSPNLTTMQNSINTINSSLSTVVSDSFTPYLILKSSALGLKGFELNDGDGQDKIDSILAEANKYRMFRINVRGTVTGNIIFSNVNYGELVFNTGTSAKLVGNLLLQSDSTIRLIRATIENGYLSVGRYSKLYMLTDTNITAPTGRSAIDIGSCSVIFTDQSTGYPPKPFNLTSDTYGIGIDNGSRFIAGRGLQINTTNTTTKINLSRGSFAALNGATISGDGTDFNIAVNTVTANGIIMR